MCVIWSSRWLRCAGKLPRTSYRVWKVRLTSTSDEIKEYLGPGKFRYGMAELEDQIGAVTGLAWTEVGGDTLIIEVTVVPGTGKLTLTGKLGDVMKESAQAAFSYTRSKATQLELRLTSMRRTISISTFRKERFRRMVHLPGLQWQQR